METKQINVVWFDDGIDDLDNDNNRILFNHHHCVLYAKAKTADELKKILEDKKKYIDAVIVDFNAGRSESFPDEDTASGFLWVHEHFEEFSPRPFYVLTGRDEDFIRRKYEAFEFPIDGDHFFSPIKNVAPQRPNRFFLKRQLDDLLKIIEEEVSCIKTPEFKVRQEYHKAFVAIEEFGLDADVFMKILLSDESIDRYELKNLANPLRMVIERMVYKMADDGVVPQGMNLNSIPDLLKGKLEKSKKYNEEDYMDITIYDAFSLLLGYTQDGSHDQPYLTVGFKKYLQENGDIYIVKALAIICLDIITWSSLFYKKYLSIIPFPPISYPFTEEVQEIVQVHDDVKDRDYEGAIVYHQGKKFFVKQFTDESKKYRIGDKVKIERNNVQKTNEIYGDFYCMGRKI